MATQMTKTLNTQSKTFSLPQEIIHRLNKMDYGVIIKE
jgi:hypothetical protein